MLNQEMSYPEDLTESVEEVVYVMQPGSFCEQAVTHTNSHEVYLFVKDAGDAVCSSSGLH